MTNETNEMTNETESSTLSQRLRGVIVGGAMGVCIGYTATMGALYLGLGSKEVRIVESKDLTGDGIVDILLDEGYARNDAWFNKRHLFIGNEDGTFTRTDRVKGKDVTYFRSEDGVSHFPVDGIYKPLTDSESLPE